jgi:hypothetical protein
MKRFFLFVMLMVATVSFAQSAPQPVDPNAPQRLEITVKQAPTPVVPASPTAPIVQQANEWVEFGRNLGSAFDAGLTSLTDHAEKLAKTDVGHFTMAVIAWKVAGKDAVQVTQMVTRQVTGLIIGVPIMIFWICVYLWVMRKFCFKYRILKSVSGPFWNRTKEYEVHAFGSEGDRAGAAIISTIIFVIVSSIVLCQVIF